MKFRKELGSEDIQDLLREISARVAELPRIDFYDPWPDDRLIQVTTIPEQTESAKQNK